MQLDKKQQEVVNSSASKICVIAGAGSGKTATLSERVRKILKDGANPYNVVCITFTNMAANEMRERLSDIPESKSMFIGTIHSYAASLIKTSKPLKLLTPEKEKKILRDLIDKYAKYIDIDSYNKWAEMSRLRELGYKTKSEIQSVLTQDQAEELCKLLDDPQLDDLSIFMNGEKSNNIVDKITDAQWQSHTSDEYPETVRTRAKSAGYITFNDLLNIASQRNTCIDYLFVDEFQDVGVFEYKFLKALNARNVFIVGDDYQCQPFHSQVLCPDGSTKYIGNLKTGDTVIGFNIETGNCEETLITCVNKSYSDKLIEVGSSSGHVSRYTPNHICIVNTALGPVEKRADHLSLSDKLLVYDNNSNTVKSVSISFIRYNYTVGKCDVYSIETTLHNYIADRVLTHNSIYGFSGADFEYFKKLTADKNFKTFKLCNNYRSNPNIVTYSNKIIKQINRVIPKRCTSKVDNPLPGRIVEKRGDLNTVIDQVKKIDTSNYGKWFILTRGNDDAIRISRRLYHMDIPSDIIKTSAFANKDQMQSTMNRNSIKIMTIHSSKGLENDNVIIYGRFPSPKNEDNITFWQTRGDEECRIFYVAATRAKRNLIVINTDSEYK